MSDINREYIKTLSKIVEKIKRLQEQVIDASNIEKNLSFKKLIDFSEELRKNIDVLKTTTEGELKTRTLNIETSLINLEGKIANIVDGLKKEIEEIKFIEGKDKELGHKIQKSLSEVINGIKEELKNLKEELKKYAEELKFTKEGLLKSPGIIGPSASGIEVQLDGVKQGVYSKLNFIEGSSITITKSEVKPEGKVNLTFNSTGGGGGGGDGSFVPYVGATQDVDLGTHNLYAMMLYLRNLSSVAFLDTEGQEVGEISMQPSPPTITFYSSTQDAQANFDMSQLTTSQTFTLPNQSGTLALAENTIAFSVALG